MWPSGVTTLLQALDGVSNGSGLHKKILFIIATNHPESIDSALLSRCKIIVHMGLPGTAERRSMLMQHVAKQVHTLTWRDLNEVCISTRGYSARDLNTLSAWSVCDSHTAMGGCSDQGGVARARGRGGCRPARGRHGRGRRALAAASSDDDDDAREGRTRPMPAHERPGRGEGSAGVGGKEATYVVTSPSFAEGGGGARNHPNKRRALALTLALWLGIAATSMNTWLYDPLQDQDSLRDACRLSHFLAQRAHTPQDIGAFLGGVVQEMCKAWDKQETCDLLMGTFVSWARQVPPDVMAAVALKGQQRVASHPYRSSSSCSSIHTCSDDVLAWSCSFLDAVDILRFEQTSRRMLHVVDVHHCLSRLRLRGRQAELIPLHRLRDLKTLEVDADNAGQLQLLEDCPPLHRCVVLCRREQW